MTGTSHHTVTVAWAHIAFPRPSAAFLRIATTRALHFIIECRKPFRRRCLTNLLLTQCHNSVPWGRDLWGERVRVVGTECPHYHADISQVSVTYVTFVSCAPKGLSPLSPVGRKSSGPIPGRQIFCRNGYSACRNVAAHAGIPSQVDMCCPLVP